MLEEGIFDIHCHIVPGVDDGAADIEETRKLLEMEYKQGVRNIILTPHFRFQMFETPLEKVQRQFPCLCTFSHLLFAFICFLLLFLLQRLLIFSLEYGSFCCFRILRSRLRLSDRSQLRKIRLL